MGIKEIKEITKNLNILYVEDDATLVVQNKELLSQLFESVKTANDGEEALHIYKDGKFDLVMTDVNIPKINGITMMRLMKDMNPSQQFLVTTVYKKEDLETYIEELDIDFFLTKPVNTKDLMESIGKVLGKLELNCS